MCTKNFTIKIKLYHFMLYKQILFLKLIKQNNFF
jgi:hypothetical protein